LNVDRLAAATRSFLQEKGGEYARSFLADWPGERALRRTPPPSTLPVLRWLQSACQRGWAGADDVQMALKAASAHLAWRQTYVAKDFGPEFLERYGWTELIGERGPIASDRIAVGFLLLGPDVTYPLHSHDAEELYLPLSEAADWKRGAEDWRGEPAGAQIFHPSRTPHAIRTGGEPLLALYAWRGGDLSQKSKIY
jgi:hypothetical protein